MEKKKRSSHCIRCGKRMSGVTSTGNIRWQPSQVDDTGLLCLSCWEAQKPPKSRKSSTTSA